MKMFEIPKIRYRKFDVSRHVIKARRTELFTQAYEANFE